MPKSTNVFVDVLTLRKDKTLAEAEAYFQKAMPVIGRHGIKRVKVIEVKTKMRGHDAVNPSMVLLWQVEAQSGFASLGADPEYQAMVPLRDTIFDIPNLQGWFGTEH